jgi:hypothetical protein
MKDWHTSLKSSFGNYGNTYNFGKSDDTKFAYVIEGAWYKKLEHHFCFAQAEPKA